MRELFNTGWTFLKTEPGTDYETAIDKKLQFDSVVIPHDFAIEKYESFYEDATGWYRKVCNLKKPAAGKVILYFDGIYMDSAVYVNGIKAGEWKYGYTQFEVDITSFIKDGENEICVSVNFLNPNSRWYSGAGITRNVYIDTVPEIYIPRYGIYANAVLKENNEWLFTVDTEIEFADIDQSEEYINSIAKKIKYSLFDDADCRVLEPEKISVMDSESNDSKSGEDNNLIKIRAEFIINNPKVWDVISPNVYVIKVELENGFVEESQFGFRTIELTTDKGAFINGRHIKLNGVCEHHDFGMLGGAFYEDAMERKLVNLRNMGVNSVRLAHNPVDPAVLNLCDRMGFLVMSEAFDMWEKSKTTYDYARFFKEWHERDVKSWVRQDRNHPCIIMWSIGNEIYDIHEGARGRELVNELSELVRKEDYLHNGYITFCSNYMPWENAQKAANDIEVVGYNYAEKYYNEHHKEHKDWIIYGSETSSICYSRSVYHFPFETPSLSDDDQQCSDLGNSNTSWGADSIEECVCFDRDTEFSLGQYIWSGHDYLGEPTPYHTKNSYLGIIDTAGYPKDPYFGWKSSFTYGNENVKPFIHITPDWDYNPGQIIDVRIYSNCPTVELFINGKSFGKKTLTHAPNSGYDIVATYKVTYEKGEIRVKGYDDNDNVIAEESRHSYKNTSKILCQKQQYQYDGKSYELGKFSKYGRRLEFYDITAIDEDGNPVDNASDLVKVSVTGGELLALDNGDSTDYTSQKSNEKRLFKGKLLAVVEKKSDEALVVNATSVKDIIPVRKIEMESLDGNYFDEAGKHIRVRSTICPSDATDTNVEYKITDSFGNVSNLAKITSIEGDIVTVEALGDGDFYLKAFSKSGTDIIRVISQLEFKASGLGEAFYNPYKLIPGSCYSKAIGTVGPGNERGVSTARGEETIVVFDRIDFGRRGSNLMILPIFSLDSERKYIDIYDGVYGEENSECLCNGIYELPSIWNVYQEEKYTLNKRLTGIHTISLRTTEKIHIKGLYCKEYNPAYEQMSIDLAENIYGDSYKVEENIVRNIGNNVTIDFGKIDFEDVKPVKAVICGRANGGRNTIHLRYNGPDGEVRNIFECDPTDEITETTIGITNISGTGNIQLIFLPGCDYDLKWIRFIPDKEGEE